MKKENYTVFLNKIRNNFFEVSNIIISYIIAILILYLYSDFWADLINRFWVNPIISKVNSNICVSTLAIIFILLIYYFRESYYISSYNFKRLYFILHIITIIGVCCISNYWYYTTIQIIAIILFCFGLVAGEFITYFNHKNKVQDLKNPSPFILDHPNANEDSFQRDKIISSIAKDIICNFHKEGSFAIGITGNWGSGKTYFICKIKDKIQELDSTVSVIEFCPWKSNSPDSIIKDFFNVLNEDLSKYIPNISITINRYILALLDKEETNYLKAFVYMINRIFNSNNTQNLYDHIKKKMEKSNHRVICFIDDIDRLEHKEILEVMKLIRNSANFPYVQYILAYDKSYIEESLEKCKIPNPKEFLEKIINMEIPLPKYEPRIICEDMKSLVSKYIRSYFDIDINSIRYERMFYLIPEETNYQDINLSYILPKLLKTKRDVIRFNNSYRELLNCFKTDQKFISEIDYFCLFYIELIRYKFLDVYNILSNNTLYLLSLEPSNNPEGFQYIFDSEDKEKYSRLTAMYNEQNLVLIKSLLNLLFDKKKKFDVDFQDISKMRSFHKYFMYRIDSKVLTQNEYNNLLQETDDVKMLEEAENLYDQKYKNEFKNRLIYNLEQIKVNASELHIYHTEHNLSKKFKSEYRIIKVLYETKKNNLKNEIKTAINFYVQTLDFYSCKQLKAIFQLFESIKIFDIENLYSMDSFIDLLVNKKKSDFINDPSYKSLVGNWIRENNWPIKTSKTIYYYLREKGTEELLFTVEDFKLFQKAIFLAYKDKLSNNGFELYKLFIFPFDRLDHSLIYDEEVNDVLYKEINSFPERFMDLFFHPIGYPNNFVLENLWYIKDELFKGSIDEIEAFAFQQKESDSRTRLINSIELYKHNDNQPCIFTDSSNYDEMKRGMFEEQITLLDELKVINKRIDKINSIRDLQKLKKSIDNNKLNIAYKEQTKKKLANRIKEISEEEFLL